MRRRAVAIAITVLAAVLAGALRTPGDEVIHDHGGVGPLGAALALVMMVVSIALLVTMLRRPRNPPALMPHRARRR
jgi:hypothetical protein